LTTREQQLEREIAAYLQAKPDARANDVAREVKGRRNDVLQIVRRLRREQ
jgi:hypothetical protein